MQFDVILKCMDFYKCDASLDIYEPGTILTKTRNKNVFIIPESVNGAFYLGENHIALKRRKTIDMLGTLCHEIIHWQQYKEKRFFRLESGYFFFENKKYNNKMNYLLSPWEKEAFGKQELYFKKFLNSLNIDTLKGIEQ